MCDSVTCQRSRAADRGTGSPWLAGTMTHNASVDAGGVLIRPREPDDLGGLVDALALVADNDGYPSHWPEQPASWLRTSDAYGAWVADRNGDLLGHVVDRKSTRLNSSHVRIS